MDRRGEDLFGWPAFYDLAFVEDGDAMADSGDGRQIVRNIEDGHSSFAIEAGEKLEDFRLRDHVEGAGRFVGEEEGRPVHDGHTDQHALRLSDAQLLGALP